MIHGDKYEKLQQNIQAMGSLAIAFSGGVDSTFLLRVAHDVLGPKALAITATSSTYPERELKEAIAFAKSIGAEHIIIRSEELDIAGFAENPQNRCYHCKKELFTKVVQIAAEKGIAHVADGSNADDTNDFRPGMTAMRELGAVSPLMDAGLSKQEIRDISKELGLRTWDKPSFACLSSRVPYGERITPDKLSMIDRAEALLLDMGFRQVRVRHHGNIARIEVGAVERARFFEGQTMDRIDKALREIGYAYVTLDLKGYRTGSMNEVI
jgi:pyridinium-3,5-biscarboxylic acid mononucleotide sulfurtransferase